MTPPLRPFSPPSLLPSRFSEEDETERQRYILTRILEGERPVLSRADLDQLDLAQRLSRLPHGERQRIQREAGGAFETLVSLSEERVPTFFYEGILRAGRRAEDEDRFGVAQRCYFFLCQLENSGVPPHVRRQARERLALLRGGGSGWDRLEFGLHRLPEQTFDPAFLIGMGTAAVVARGLRLGLLARAAGRGTFSARFLPRLFEAGILGIAESVAFVGAERASAALLGEPASPVSVPEEWLRYGLPMFLGTRLAGTLAGQLYRRGHFRRPWPVNGSLEEARLRHRLGYGLATQASIFGATYLAQELESREAAAQRRPHDAVANALLWALTFSVFQTAARRTSGTRSIAWERGLFRR